MKKIVILVAMVSMCVVSAKASFDPGAPVDPNGSGSDPTWTLYDDHTPPVGDLGTYSVGLASETYTLNLTLGTGNGGTFVVNGDVIVLESGTDPSKANWSDVLNFSNNTIATLTSYDGSDAATFWASYAPSANAVYIQETGGQYTVWNPGGGPNVYNIDSTAVPEPTTMLAGALLLLPFGVSTFRILRRNCIG